MTNDTALWQQIDRDKNKYKAFMVFCFIAWAITLSVLAYIGYLYYLEFEVVLSKLEVALANKSDVYLAKQNILSVLVAITFLIAVLATIVVFMRQRSASLQDIQLRLTLLEQSISDKS